MAAKQYRLIAFHMNMRGVRADPIASELIMFYTYLFRFSFDPRSTR